MPAVQQQSTSNVAGIKLLSWAIVASIVQLTTVRFLDTILAIAIALFTLVGANTSAPTICTDEVRH